MIRITSDHIDAVYDATQTMSLFTQILSHDNTAAEMSWLLGSAKKRLSPVIDLLERLETKQRECASDLAILDDVIALEQRLEKLREARA